ncbi:phytanoyl-CoA dioxygenase family protein [Bradyrhizobium sp. sBnM-33]|uniref:phytanoyl-CoA dioxygenase family protein n=1 Tax=Bradyrhizobium sp. sBnM-33 TaxID=2831780 RepID=UPI001BD009E7|nr:phytanoyl-CoA dioxygenase family protein [Bradyrhizobium sp. sBnM-33]WOH53503.1 phytanoyl-CoA dioxygenase family protein [Bradyrhizobium sp. sBnM-33]
MTTRIELSKPDTTTFAKDGALRIRRALDASDLRGLENAVASLPPDQAGIRLYGIPALRPLLTSSGAIWNVAASVLGDAARPVRAILFDKTASTNWGLPWHQDRTIVVDRRVEVEGFGPWTIKSGLLHVAPPFELLAGMVTLRVHLDAVPKTNAPLLIAPGSHRLGQIPEGRLKSVIRHCGTATCLADAGDIWLYSTPILHCSEAARAPAHRRVLQVDFAASDLPGGLTWLAI